MGPEAAKDFQGNSAFKANSVIEKGGGVVLPFPGKIEKGVEPVKKETSKESGERMRRNRRRIGWILLGTLPPVTTEAVLETIHDTGHAEIIPWYDSVRDKVVNGVKSLFVKTPEGEVIGTIPETKPPETTSLPVASETTPSTTAQETVPPTTEVTPQTVEYKGSVFTLPEWSEANPQTGEILALDGNPYNVEAGTKIGQCIKDAFELDGKMVNSEAFIPPVIEYLQKKIMEENEEFKYALPFYPDKGIKITEIEDKGFTTNNPVIWDKPRLLAISNLSLGAILCSPVSTSNLMIWNQSEKNNWYGFSFTAKDGVNNKQYDLNFQGNKIDGAWINIAIIGVEIIPSELNEKFPKEGIRGLENLKSEIGTPIAKIKEEQYLNTDIYHLNKEDKITLLMSLQMGQWMYDENNKKNENAGIVETGSPNLLTIENEAGSKEGIIISTLPNE